MSAAFHNPVGPAVRGGAWPTRRWLVPALVILALVGSLQAATQVSAAALHHHPALGTRLFGVYPPWAVLVWAARFGADRPEAFPGAAGVVLVGVLTSALGVRAAVRRGARAQRFLHGSARWAVRRDIESAGLLPRAEWLSPRGHDRDVSSVYVGSWMDGLGRQHYLRHDGPEHVLCYAPTRSGKGVGLVVPTLLSWPKSAFITDLKGELWELTAGWRTSGARNTALRFEPASLTRTVRWNPLDEIRLGTSDEVGDVQNLATLLVDPDGKGLESHWQKTAQALLVGVILHVLYKADLEGTPASLAEVDRLLADPVRPASELWTEMVSYRHLDDRRTCHPAVGSAGRDMLDRPADEGGSVLSTAKSYLALYRDPVISANTSVSDFRVRDLMHGPVPVSLYLVTQPTDKDRLRPLVRILVNMTLRLLADRIGFEGGRPKPLYKHRLLLMLDEFTALKRLAILQESLAYIAGYGLKAYLICQDIEQLKSQSEGYGRDETITSNCHVQVAFPPNRLETAEHLSRLTGTTTVQHDQVTRSGTGLFAPRSRTTQAVQRALLTPDECLRLPGPVKDASGQITKAGDMLVFTAGAPAIYGRQPLYFQDPIFAARAALPPPDGAPR